MVTDNDLLKKIYEMHPEMLNQQTQASKSESITRNLC